ncbi:hypothetical protein Vadar_029839 [Vaccinium darrowii]|uniref:Uncharacterized protein n=1 Tax=Vaccinium darrowii TaxID=229202 RepID=A0ACB7XVM8_9ERIC|nr:hypothetical protein Vadar_029839 [Vaccinium darrowii]
MTRPTKHRFLSPELSPTSSSASETPKFNHHHRKFPKLPHSLPREPDPSDEEDEDEDEDELTSVTSPNNNQFPHSLASNSPNSPKSIPQIDSYVNIAPFPIFKGTPSECPSAHLSRFSKVCRANNVSSVETMMNIFPVTLENEAALWYDLNVEPCPSLTWEEIKSLFTDAYRKPDYDKQLRFELMNLNQEQGESVRSYYLRLQWILKQWPGNGIPEPLLKGVFVDGLRRDFKDWVVPQKPDSLGDALRLAFTWEQVRIIRREDREENAKCGFCEGGHEEFECEIKGRMKEWLIRSKEEKRFGGLLEKIEVGSRSGGEETEELASAREPRREREEEEEEVVVYGQKKSGCKCSKHRCGKKRLERNKSVVTVNSSNLG